MTNIAREYHQQRHGNCAQSVVHAWNLKNPDKVKPVDYYAEAGGGRALGGLCGALYASCELAEGDSCDTIKKAFAEKTGGKLKCREVRAAGQLSCNECVALAATLLEMHGSAET